MGNRQQQAFMQQLRQAEAYLSSADPKLSALVQQHGPCQLNPFARPPLEYLVRSIISQQLSSKAAATIVGRVERLLGDGGFSAEAILAQSYDDLRACGLSHAKASYTLGIASVCREGQLDFAALSELSTEQAIAELTRLKGVGEWTAQMFCIFALGHLDVFATADIGLQRALQRLFALSDKPPATQMQELTAHWQPYRSVASWYLWRMADNA